MERSPKAMQKHKVWQKATMTNEQNWWEVDEFEWKKAYKWKLNNFEDYWDIYKEKEISIFK